MKSHEDWMSLAYQLAKSTVGQTSPNPPVAAVIVKDGCIKGLGVHVKAGEAHAEMHALEMAGVEAKGSTMYVTLEPCSHIGKTPACVESIIRSGIRKVCVSTKDRDIRVAGKGIQRLKEAGLEVIEDVLSKESFFLYEAYFHHRETGLPYVTLKTAMTLDGKIATKNGDSKWITGEKSREYVHVLRHQHDAILVGVATVITDNPALSTRLKGGGIHPHRIVLDSTLRIPLESTILTDSLAPTWIFTTERKDVKKEKILLDRGISVISTGVGPRVEIEKVLRHLGDYGILSVLVEGGSEVNGAMMHYAQKVISFITPKLLGGKESISVIGGINPSYVSEARPLQDIKVTYFEEDLCITGYFK